MTLAVRRANAADVRGLTALINRAFLVEAFFVDGDRTNAGDVADKMRAGVFLAAEDAGGLAGCVYAEHRPGARGYIGLLAVDPSRKGQGIGRLLMQAAEDWCRESGCTAVELSVVSLRQELFPFYGALGYEEHSVEPFDVRPTKLPCHFVVMTKPLAPRDGRPITMLGD
jgi:GNAT superfamily N-acetyltransferase